MSSSAAASSCWGARRRRHRRSSGMVTAHGQGAALPHPDREQIEPLVRHRPPRPRTIAFTTPVTRSLIATPARSTLDATAYESASACSGPGGRPCAGRRRQAAASTATDRRCPISPVVGSLESGGARDELVANARPGVEPGPLQFGGDQVGVRPLRVHGPKRQRPAGGSVDRPTAVWASVHRQRTPSTRIPRAHSAPDINASTAWTVTRSRSPVTGAHPKISSGRAGASPGDSVVSPPDAPVAP